MFDYKTTNANSVELELMLMKENHKNFIFNVDFLNLATKLPLNLVSSYLPIRRKKIKLIKTEQRTMLMIMQYLYCIEVQFFNRKLTPIEDNKIKAPAIIVVITNS